MTGSDATAVPAADATAERMRRYWDARARERAMWFIHSSLDYRHPDEAAFWRSGMETLDHTLAPFGLELDRHQRVLEIGCGIGRITRAIAERSGSVVGVDVSVEMVERGRRLLAAVPNVELVLGNGRDLDGLPDDEFDAAYSFIVFQHIPDPAITCSYIREMGRVLRPGGWAVFQVSERPEIHRREHWTASEPLSARIARRLGRRPTGTLEAEWLGSSLGRAQLLDALADGGLRLESIDGGGTQFCLVHASRPGGAP